MLGELERDELPGVAAVVENGSERLAKARTGEEFGQAFPAGIEALRVGTDPAVRRLHVPGLVPVANPEILVAAVPGVEAIDLGLGEAVGEPARGARAAFTELGRRDGRREHEVGDEGGDERGPGARGLAVASRTAPHRVHARQVALRTNSSTTSIM